MVRIKIFFILLLLGLGNLSFGQVPDCPEYKFESSEFSFKSFNPLAESISSIAFPGGNQILYRGAYESNPQFSFEKALKGLMMQKNWHIGSPVFFGISQVLTGQWTLDNTFFPTGNLPYKMRDYFEARQILTDVQILLTCKGNKTYDTEMAEILAADLMNKTFKRMTADQIETRYFNIAHPTYNQQPVQRLGFGNNAADLIISSTYDLVAALYGSKMLVLEDKRKRSLDLSFYNFKKNGFYYYHWVDNGEINAPGYIKPDELLGYQQRKMDRVKENWAQTIPDSAIDFAVYRAKIDNTIVTLVLDGSNSYCMMPGNDGRYYHCHNYWTDLMKKPVPYPTANIAGGKIPLMGVIATCPSQDNCPIVDKVAQWYGRNGRRALPSEWIKRIEALEVNGQKLIYNATAAASAFLNGYSEREYKVSSHYIKTPNFRIPRKFEIQWKCKDSADRAVKTLRIPAPAEGKKIIISCYFNPD